MKKKLLPLAAFALMLGMVASSPLSVSFEMPKSKTREGSHEIVHSDADMARYLAAVHGCEIEGAIILMACGGLRVGEALGVKACEIERSIDEYHLNAIKNGF